LHVLLEKKMLHFQKKKLYAKSFSFLCYVGCIFSLIFILTLHIPKKKIYIYKLKTIIPCYHNMLDAQIKNPSDKS